MQRTVLGKLGIKGDQITSNLGSEKTKTTTRTSSHQYPDGKASRGPDLKKKMKKSGSIKRSSTNSLRSFPFGTGIPQPGKPPPCGVRVPDSADVTPQKQPEVRPDDGLPNYMKPTSSSYARKERSSMTPPSTRTGSDTKRAARRVSSASSKMGSPLHDNSETPVKNLKRSSSLRLVRTLTKTTIFKPARSSSTKRCSKVVLCTDVNVQRATCSSTLKDSKFPKYLTLSPGATEAEGTSATKVCPYTYCSLNGHHRSPLPPLRCFISSRRMAMKAQRSRNSEALKTDAEEEILVDRPKNVQADDCRGFFIEIYAENDDKDISSPESFPEEEKESEVQEGVDFPSSVSEAAPPVESFQGKYDSEAECHESLEEEGSESSDMDWDGDCYSTFELDEALEHLTEKDDVPETEKPEACPDFLLIHWKNVLDEKLQQGEDEACPEDELPADPVSEICELGQVLDFSSYNQYSSSEEDGLEEVTADGEETAESLTEEPSADQAESIGIDPTLHEPQQNQDSSSTCFSFEREPETSGGQLCQEKEDIAVDKASEDMAVVGSQEEPQDLVSDEQQCQIKDVNQSQNFKILDEANEEKMEIIAASEGSAAEVDQKEVEIHAQTSIAEETLLESHDPTSEKSKSKYTRAERNSRQDSDPSKIWIGKNRCKSLSEEEENPRRFNPRDPNYLPIVPKPEAEKVDLRHQEMDDRRNSDEWMVDYALRQAVTRLAPARKRKVALLVEAFEKVMPIPRVNPVSKWETHHTSPRPMQACS